MTAIDRFRRDLLRLAAEHNANTLLIVFNIGMEESVARDAARSQPVGKEVILRQHAKFLTSIEEIESEPWVSVAFINADTLDTVGISRPLGTFDLRHLHGPFDVIGDVHGCLDELLELLDRLGYKRRCRCTPRHNRREGRK